MDQIITEDWYKNLFRLLNSPRPEASAEIKSICDNLLVLYEQHGITEYFPPIPGDTQTSADGTAGSADFAPVSSRKFEKPIAPIRKDSISIDRLSPHLGTLRSNSPRLLSTNSVDSATTPINNKTVSVVSDDQSIRVDAINLSSDSINVSSDNIIITASSDDANESLLNSSDGQIGLQSTRSSDDAGSDILSTQKRDVDRRTRSDETQASSIDDQPMQKKAKMTQDEDASMTKEVGQNTRISESEKADHDFDELACVVCKMLNLVPGNFMVECHECNRMYHQKCHQPNIPSSQMNDPRLLWYCNECEKRNRGSTDTATAASSKTSPAASISGRRNTGGASLKDEKKQPEIQTNSKRNSVSESKSKQQRSTVPSWMSQAGMAPKPSNAELLSKAAKFLETNKKKPLSTPVQKPASTTTNPFAMALSTAANSSTGLAKLASSTPTTTAGGLSKLAGSFQQQASTSSSSKPATTSSTTSSTAVSSAINNASKQLAASNAQQMQAAAEKRLQMMKKKAAMKGSFR